MGYTRGNESNEEIKDEDRQLILIFSNYNNNMVSRAAIDFESVCFLGKGGFGEVIKVL